MAMLDYRLVEAVAAVLIEGGFDRAAGVLHITQSAVSQRVRLLEEQLGQVLLVRASPPRATAAGSRLLRHWRQVAELEGDLQSPPPDGKVHRSVSIAINADSLATWFMEAVEQVTADHGLTLDLRVDDQDLTRDHLRSGTVMGAVSSHERPIQGCVRHSLGTMHYRMAAAPEAARHWFAQGMNRASTAIVPAVIFNRQDQLHHRLLSRILDGQPERAPVHYIPSSERFVDCICRGLGYGAVPILQGEDAVAQGRLVWLSEIMEPVDLYWHVWSRRSKLLEALSQALRTQGARLIR